ncbi:MAG: ribonuclease III domain-containing protein [Firmicutes bacterium]|nr:ribonuclease III domain-containing protein [Bacillota bacterium]MDD4793256.1 ribonuclease III domain-containing protein [Bacillota bacterium]
MNLSEAQVREMSPLNLAYVGDAVWELHVRSELAAGGGACIRVNALHCAAEEMVNAEAQSRIVHLLMDFLSKEERDVVRRGRNVKPGHAFRGSDPIDYRYATGFEALLGHMYLSGKTERLRRIMDEAVALGQRKDGVEEPANG